MEVELGTDDGLAPRCKSGGAFGVGGSRWSVLMRGECNRVVPTSLRRVQLARLGSAVTNVCVVTGAVTLKRRSVY